ncbi:MAG: peroxiredoxin [Actinomycetota bacterium]|nr:peroxiredoxin [Actinomycetota bacterium]
MGKLVPGDAAPEFVAEDAQGKTWRLADLRGNKVILYFYPADDTPGCTAQACDFRDAHSELSDLGYIVLGASPQGAGSHESFAAKYRLNFPLLVDEDMSLASAYSATGEFGEFEGIPLTVQRATFVIDEQGTIEQALYGVNARTHVAALKDSLAG